VRVGDGRNRHGIVARVRVHLFVPQARLKEKREARIDEREQV
jgi:hypothetical protein